MGHFFRVVLITFHRTHIEDFEEKLQNFQYIYLKIVRDICQNMERRSNQDFQCGLLFPRILKRMAIC